MVRSNPAKTTSNKCHRGFLTAGVGAGFGSAAGIGVVGGKSWDEAISKVSISRQASTTSVTFTSISI